MIHRLTHVDGIDSSVQLLSGLRSVCVMATRPVSVPAAAAAAAAARLVAACLFSAILVALNLQLNGHSSLQAALQHFRLVCRMRLLQASGLFACQALPCLLPLTLVRSNKTCSMANGQPKAKAKALSRPSRGVLHTHTLQSIPILSVCSEKFPS